MFNQTIDLSMKVEFTQLNSANVTADNSVDEAKKYDITARVNIEGNTVSTIDGGRVVKDGIEVASFSKWGENNSQKRFNGVSDEEQSIILNEINAFCRNVTEKVTDEPIEL